VRCGEFSQRKEIHRVLVGHFEGKDGAIRPCGIFSFGREGWRRHSLIVLRFLTRSEHAAISHLFEIKGFADQIH
jgi:hypothetical protein